MTLEEVIEAPASWEALTPAKQEAFFAPYLNVTRPDRESAIHKEKKSSSGGGKMSDRKRAFLAMDKDKQMQLLELMKEEGLEF
jgi:hypothetical protein